MLLNDTIAITLQCTIVKRALLSCYNALSLSAHCYLVVIPYHMLNNTISALLTIVVYYIITVLSYLILKVILLRRDMTGATIESGNYLYLVIVLRGQGL